MQYIASKRSIAITGRVANVATPPPFPAQADGVNVRGALRTEAAAGGCSLQPWRVPDKDALQDAPPIRCEQTECGEPDVFGTREPARAILVQDSVNRCHACSAVHAPRARVCPVGDPRCRGNQTDTQGL